MKRILLIGVGPHARTFYIPRIAERRRSARLDIVAAVELEHVVELASSQLAASGFEARVAAVPRFEHELPAEADHALGALITASRPDGVIVATDPLTHRAYTGWALRNDLPVLLDKPISSRRNAVTDPAAARGIETDFEALVAELEEARGRARVCVSVCAHRRWHPAIDHVLSLVEDVSSQTGCPVTSVHGHHSDGQWRFPAEMVAQDHHSYHQGHGKLSHSGHHFLDTAWRFVQAGYASGKEYDGVEIVASFVQPDGHIKQLTRRDYVALFGDEYEANAPLSDEELAALLPSFGELDVSATATFTLDGVPSCNASFDLLHNGWSRRAWVRPGADLYKGNGRVKHEHHRVHVGPFLAVHVHSYQSKDKHDQSDAADLSVGGNNHFEVVAFTNSGVLGGRPSLEVLGSEHWVENESQLLIEEVKAGALEEFARFLHGEIEERELRSPLDDHRVPVKMLSGMYRSHVARRAGESPIIRYDLR